MSAEMFEIFDPIFSDLALNFFENTLDDAENQVALHWHDRLEVIHVLSGKGEIAIEFQNYSLEAGDLVLVAPSALHAIRGCAGMQMTSQAAIFSLDCMHPACDYQPVIRPGMEGYPEMTSIMNALFSMEHRASGSPELIFRGYLTALYGLIVHHHYECSTPALDFSANETIREVLSYIHDHYSEKITLDILAEIAGYSKFYFTRYFLSHVGCSCSRYIQSYRLAMAKRLLRTTDLNIAAVSQQVGMENSSYFTKIFREYEHLTPRQYRQQMLSCRIQ